MHANLFDRHRCIFKIVQQQRRRQCFGIEPDIGKQLRRDKRVGVVLTAGDIQIHTPLREQRHRRLQQRTLLRIEPRH